MLLTHPVSNYVEFSCSTPPTQRPPVRLARRAVDVLLLSMVRDGLIAPRHRRALLSSLTLLERDEVTLKVLESIAPSEVYRVFRYLRRVFSDDVEGLPAVYPLLLEMPLTSVLPPLYTLALSPWRPSKVMIEACPGLEPRVMRILEHASAALGVSVEFVKCRGGAGALAVLGEAEPIDMLEIALGDLKKTGSDILSEVVGGGGVMTGRALMDLLDEQGLRALRLLLAFDFLRAYPSQGGLLIYVSEKGLEYALSRA
ncbi:MAG: hypothetical protein DRJ96_02775 [Thermoprotei archaeon]|nr:MAG: hypothetical protein DRJ67_01980 [Thermoprotei archaeon]RLE97839.1 MAG: hypothetical protein DRJ96_02775 [Thermoprotei archaeon]